jgi:phosphatidylserine/phosphatidylglycerophosphate/cardiolipin synthase-like enzyme
MASRSSLLGTQSPFLGGGYFAAEGRDDPRQRVAELAAGCPFTRELGEVVREYDEAPESEDLFGGFFKRLLCSPFIGEVTGDAHDKYVAAPTTGLMTPFINGRYWGGAKPRHDEFKAFDSMQTAVEGLKRGDRLFLAAWMFDPTLPLTAASSTGAATWGELFQKKARDGVTIRLLMTDFSAVFKDQLDKLQNTFLPTLDKLIAGLPSAARDRLKYVVSLHPATHLRIHVGTHHQKFMVVKTAQATTAFCGGLDLAFMRTPRYWGKLDDTRYRWLWHDAHCKLEGLIAHDLEREFTIRWNAQKSQSVTPAQPGWKAMETLAPTAPTFTDKLASKNPHRLQMQRTVSGQGTGSHIQDTQRDDVWQGYLRLIGCATSFLYMENQYFREPRMADAIVKQAQAQPALVVIVVVPSETDDLPDPGKKHGDSRQHEFFQRLTKGIPPGRLRVYTMFHRIIHSKLILADDRMMSIGSANANPRSFFLDTELNVMLRDNAATRAFRCRLWAHNLGLAEAVVDSWKPAGFIARWDAVASSNDTLKARPEKMTGEAVIPWDPLAEKGERQAIIDDVETESSDVAGSP